MRRVRVAIETQFARGTPTGLGVYARGLSRALAERPDVDVVELADPSFDVWRLDRRVYWDQLRAPQLARRSRADVIHFTGGTLPLLTPHPCVLTLHDLAWLHHAVDGGLHARLYFEALQRRLVTRADRIVTVSQTSREDIVDHLRVAPSTVAVTGEGIDDSWFALERRPIDPPYLLCVGTVEARKDLVTPVRALRELPDFRLISVGPYTSYVTHVVRAVSEANVRERVELRGYVDDADVRSLYEGASALVFPSRYEGFGLPPLQALAAGVPVVASDIPVLREVLGDCAFFARAGEPASFAQSVRAALAPDAREKIERGRVHARSFSWSDVAQRVTGVYRSLLEGERS
jgi:glycosyltransferase involved in cell wall biosynthesis